MPAAATIFEGGGFGGASLSYYVVK